MRTTDARALAAYTRQLLMPPNAHTEALRCIAAMPANHDFTACGWSELTTAMAQVARDALEEEG